MILLGIIIILKGLLGIFFNLENIPGLWGKSPMYFDDPQSGLIIGSIEIIVGIGVFVYSIVRKRNIKAIEFSKCPKCKESYIYINLNEGICPNCKIKTIDIDKYFEKFPDELE